MQSADTKRKLRRDVVAVYGYCRNLRPKSFISAIIDICVDFYADPEEFDPEHNYHGMAFDKDDKWIIYNGAKITWTTIFGKVIVRKNERFEWNFKMIGKPEPNRNNWKVVIGVVPSTWKKTTPHSYTFIAPNWGFIGADRRLSWPDPSPRKEVDQAFGEKEGDTMRMTLDLKEYKLHYVINGIQNGYCIDKLEQQDYRMAVSLCKGRKLKLVSADFL